MVARLVGVNVVHMIRADKGGPVGSTAIDKRPVPHPVAVHHLGLAGDTQCDTEHHGGRDKAVYAFASEDYAFWEQELDRTFTPGSFGENLTTEGLEVSDAVVGERWQIGHGRRDEVILEVSMPRTPCATFQRWMGEPQWVRRFTRHGRVGAYLRVIQPGTIRAGDRVEVIHTPDHGVRLTEVFAARHGATHLVPRMAMAEELPERLLEWARNSLVTNQKR